MLESRNSVIPPELVVIVALPAVLLFSNSVVPPELVTIDMLPAVDVSKNPVVPPKLVVIIVSPLVFALTTKKRPPFTTTVPTMEAVVPALPNCNRPDVTRRASGIAVRAGQYQRTGATRRKRTGPAD